MKKIILFVIFIALLAEFILLWQQGHRPFAKPIRPQNIPDIIIPKTIIGFLPYWQLQNVTDQNLDPVDEVIYFALHLESNGTITKDEPGWKNLVSQTGQSLLSTQRSRNKKIVIAISLQDQKMIQSFLENKSAQKEAEREIIDIVKQYSFSGVNIDFEYAGIPGKELVSAYTSFLSDLHTQLQNDLPNTTLSVDITPDAIQKSRLYDVSSIATIADSIIIMGYDFYKPTSSVAGPVAPLTGKDVYEYDVTSAVSDFLGVVPNEKLVLGVPYYGWDFPTNDAQKGSFVQKQTGETVVLSTFKRNISLLSQPHVQKQIDADSQTPWLTYKDPDTGTMRQVWYEDALSLGKKFDLVTNQNIAGVAIWALGYDGDSTQIRDILLQKLAK